jgi:hypothetical protein
LIIKAAYQDKRFDPNLLNIIMNYVKNNQDIIINNFLKFNLTYQDQYSIELKEIQKWDKENSDDEKLLEEEYLIQKQLRQQRQPRITQKQQQVNAILKKYGLLEEKKEDH